MAKLPTKLKGIRLPLGMIEEIEELQQEKHLTTFTQAMMYLMRVGLDKTLPSYLKGRNRKTETEKILERRDAEELSKKLHDQDQRAKIKEIDGTRSDENGRADANGDYVTYQEYSRIAGDNPVRLAISTMTNPLRLIDEIITEQFEGDTKENILALLESGEFTKVK